MNVSPTTSCMPMEPTSTSTPTRTTGTYDFRPRNLMDIGALVSILVFIVAILTGCITLSMRLDRLERVQTDQGIAQQNETARREQLAKDAAESQRQELLLLAETNQRIAHIEGSIYDISQRKREP